MTHEAALNPLSLGLIAAFFVWMIVIGWRTHRIYGQAKAQEGFLIGNRNLPAVLVSIGIVMGWTDAIQYGITTALGFEYGWGCLSYIGGAVAGFLALAFVAGRIRDRAAETGAYMIGNYAARAFSPRCGALVGVAMLAFFLVWLSLQFRIGGQALASITGMPAGGMVILMGLVTLAYMLLGGFLASIRADIIQFFIVLVFLGVLACSYFPQASTWLPPVATLSRMEPSAAFAFFMVNLLSTMVAPDVWQRIYSARNHREASLSMVYAAGLVILVVGFFSVIGMLVKSNGLAADSNNLAPVVLGLLPPVLFPLVVAAFMAAVMSTIATTLFGASMTLASDIASELGWVSKPGLERTCRWLMVLLLPVAIGMAYLPVDMVNIAFTCMGATLAVLPLAAAMVFNLRLKEQAVFYSLLVSLAVYATGAWFSIYTGYLAVLPFLVSLGVLLVLQGMYQSDKIRPAHA